MVNFIVDMLLKRYYALLCCGTVEKRFWAIIHGKLSMHFAVYYLPVVLFLTRTFRNVLYVRVGKRYVRLWRSQRSRMVV